MADLRRVTLALIALFALVCSSSSEAVSQASASASCQAAASNRESQADWQNPANGFSWTARCVVYDYVPNVSAPRYDLNWCSNGGCASSSYPFDAYVYGDGTYACMPPNEPGPVQGECNAPSTEDCEALADEANDSSSSSYNPESAVSARSYASKCIGGCSFSAIGPTTSTTFGGVTTTFGHFGFTGSACSIEPASPKPAVVPAAPTEQVCSPAVNGQSYCTNQKGESCYTASTGRQICWAKGETGTKTDGPILQKRSPGNPSPAVPPTAPPGETISQVGTPTTITTTTTINNVTTTTTTTTINYTTTNGTNGGETDQGGPEGSTTGSGSNGTQGTSSGGTDCTSPPVSTGDGVLVQIAHQSWATRCAVSEGLKGSVSFADVATAAGEGEGETTAEDAFGDPGTETGIEAGFDDTGFLSAARECPSLPTLTMPDGGTIDLDEKFENFCEFMRIGGLFVYLFGALASIKIYSRVFS